MIRITRSAVEVFTVEDSIKELSKKEKLDLIKGFFQEEYQGKTVTYTIEGEEINPIINKNTRLKFGNKGEREEAKQFRARITIGANNEFMTLIKGAQYHYSREELKEEENQMHQATKEWHYFIKPILYEDEYYRVNINVRENHRGELFVYAVTLSELGEDIEIVEENEQEKNEANLSDLNDTDYAVRLDDNNISETQNEVNSPEEIISSFREKTNELFDRSAFGGLSPEDIEDDIRASIRETLYMNGMEQNVEIDDVIIAGSRSRGLESDGSDLDIIFSYKSPIVEGSRGYKEDELFNLLNDYDENDEVERDLHELHGIKIDINPIRPEETGFLSDYLLKAEEFLENRKVELRRSEIIKEQKEYLEEEAKEIIEKESEMEGENNIFGKGSWGIEYITHRGDYRVYQIDHPQRSVAYVDSINEAREEAKERGIELVLGSVEYSFDENNNRIPRFVPQDEKGNVIKEPERMVKMQNRLDIERLYSLDEVYEEADGKAHLSPELKRKDEALIEFTDWLHNNGYMAERSAFDSWEDAMDHTIKAWNISALFSDSGTLVYVREGKERLNSLEKDYIYELSSSQIQNMLDDFANDRPSLPEGLFYERGNTIGGDPVFTAIDNSGGEMYMEDFKTYYSMVHYLEGEDTDTLHEREREWESGLDGGRTVIQLFRHEIEELKRDNNLDSDSEVFERFKDETFTKDFFKKEESEVAETKDVREIIKKNVLGKENEVMADEMKNVQEEQKEGDVKKVYINLHKSFCHQMDDKFEEGKLFNTMTMPKGTTLNGQDLSGCTIHPKYMNENQKNPNEMTATYYVSNDAPLEVNVNKDGNTIGKVNVEELKDAIDKQRESFKEQQKEKEKQKEQNKDAAKEKDKGEEIE